MGTSMGTLEHAVQVRRNSESLSCSTAGLDLLRFTTLTQGLDGGLENGGLNYSWH